MLMLLFLHGPPSETLSSCSPAGHADEGSVSSHFGYCRTSGGAPSRFFLRVAFQGYILSLSFLPEFVASVTLFLGCFWFVLWSNLLGACPTNISCSLCEWFTSIWLLIIHFIASSFAVCFAKVSLSFVVQEHLISFLVSCNHHSRCSMEGGHSSC